MNIYLCEQGSPEWHELRRGVPTASNFDRILTPKNGKLSAQADDYIADLIGDLFSPMYPLNAEHWAVTNAAIRYGQETEIEARRYYAFHCSRDVEQVGFCTTDDGRFGCSPDGLVGEQGGLELKCPKPGTHSGYLLAGALPAAYKPQVHGPLAFAFLNSAPFQWPEWHALSRVQPDRIISTPRQWWDFMSYHPGLAPLLVRVERDEYTKTLAMALEQFWSRYQDALTKIKGAVCATRMSRICQRCQSS